MESILSVKSSPVLGRRFCGKYTFCKFLALIGASLFFQEADFRLFRLFRDNFNHEWKMIPPKTKTAQVKLSQNKPGIDLEMFFIPKWSIKVKNIREVG